MVHDVRFSAAYKGPAVEAGRMNAKVLAPALFGLAELVERSAQVVYGQPDLLTVQVDANFRRGSFEIDLMAAAITFGAQPNLVRLSIEQIDVLLRWIGLVGGADDSLFGALKLLGGRRVERTEPTQRGGTNIIITGDHAHVTVSPPVIGLLTDVDTRAAACSVVEPLEQPGVASFESRAQGAGARDTQPLILTASDLPALRAPVDVERNLSDSTSLTAVEIISPSFADGNKWRVAQGGASFWVSITDKEFLAQVAQGKSFAQGDYLIGEMRARAYTTRKGLDVERELVRVIDHVRRDQQTRLEL